MNADGGVGTGEPALKDHLYRRGARTLAKELAQHVFPTAAMAHTRRSVSLARQGRPAMFCYAHYANACWCMLCIVCMCIHLHMRWALDDVDEVHGCRLRLSHIKHSVSKIRATETFAVDGGWPFWHSCVFSLSELQVK